MRALDAMISLSKPSIGDAEREAVMRVLDSGMLAQGPEVAAFEQEFSTAVDGRSCVAVNSGTSALHVALAALGIGPGDEVIVPSFTFAATANSVRIVGAEPIFADIDPANFCLSPSAVQAAVTDRTRAIMPSSLETRLARSGGSVATASGWWPTVVYSSMNRRARGLSKLKVDSWSSRDLALETRHR